MPQANQVRTRASQTLGNDRVPTQEELLKLDEGVLSSTKQAHDYLETQGYMPKDTQGNRMTLAHTLLLLAHCAPQAMLPRGIQAVATILENEAATKMADAVVANIAKRTNPLELVEEVADTMQGVMTELRKAANMLYSTCEDIRDEIHKAAECERGDAKAGGRC